MQEGQPGTQGDGQAIHRVMITVQQALIDKVYSVGVVSKCSQSVFRNRGWKTAKHSPGHAPLPSDETVVHNIKIDANVPKLWGRPVSFATDAAQKPTGLYFGEVASLAAVEAALEKFGAK